MSEEKNQEMDSLWGEDVVALRAEGDWIKRYPQVVCGTDASPWQHDLPWGDITTKDNTLFLNIFTWPTSGTLHLPGLQTETYKISVSCLEGEINSASLKSIHFTPIML